MQQSLASNSNRSNVPYGTSPKTLAVQRDAARNILNVRKNPDDKFEAALYHWGDYSEDEELDRADLNQMIEITHHDVAGTIEKRGEDRDKRWFAYPEDLETDYVATKNVYAISKDLIKENPETELPNRMVKVGDIVKIRAGAKQSVAMIKARVLGIGESSYELEIIEKDPLDILQIGQEITEPKFTVRANPGRLVAEPRTNQNKIADFKFNVGDMVTPIAPPFYDPDKRPRQKNFMLCKVKEQEKYNGYNRYLVTCAGDIGIRTFYEDGLMLITEMIEVSKSNPVFSKEIAQGKAYWHRVRGRRSRVVPRSGGFTHYVDGQKETPGSAKTKAVASAEDIRGDKKLARVLPVMGGHEVFKGGKKAPSRKAAVKAKPKAKAIPAVKKKPPVKKEEKPKPATRIKVPKLKAPKIDSKYFTWKATPVDIQDKWQNQYASILKMTEKSDELIKGLDDQLKTLKGQRGKEFTEQRNALKEAINAIKAQVHEVSKELEDGYLEDSIAFAAKMDEKSKDKGLSDEDAEFVRTRVMNIMSDTRVAGERYWKSPLKDIYKDHLPKYEPKPPEPKEPMKPPGPTESPLEGAAPAGPPDSAIAESMVTALKGLMAD